MSVRNVPKVARPQFPSEGLISEHGDRDAGVKNRPMREELSQAAMAETCKLAAAMFTDMGLSSLIPQSVIPRGPLLYAARHPQ
jgi:hypothetical protein